MSLMFFNSNLKMSNKSSEGWNISNSFPTSIKWSNNRLTIKNSLTSLKGFPNSVTNSFNSFHTCNNLKNLSNFDFSYIENGVDMFNGCSSLNLNNQYTINLKSNNSVNLSYCFFNTTNITSGIILNTKKDDIIEESFYNSSITYLGDVIANDATKAFRNCRNLRQVGDVSITSKGNNAFRDCYNLQNVGNINVYSEEGIFSRCYNLTNVGIVNINQAWHTFSQCNQLYNIGDIQINKGQALFYQCHNLYSVNNISINQASIIFDNCSNLIDVYNAQIQRGTNVFNNCIRLQSVNFTSNCNITSNSSLIIDCPNIKYISFGTEVRGNNSSIFSLGNATKNAVRFNVGRSSGLITTFYNINQFYRKQYADSPDWGVNNFEAYTYNWTGPIKASFSNSVIKVYPNNSYFSLNGHYQNGQMYIGATQYASNLFIDTKGHIPNFGRLTQINTTVNINIPLLNMSDGKKRIQMEFNSFCNNIIKPYCLMEKYYYELWNQLKDIDKETIDFYDYPVERTIQNCNTKLVINSYEQQIRIDCDLYDQFLLATNIISVNPDGSRTWNTMDVNFRHRFFIRDNKLYNTIMTDRVYSNHLFIYNYDSVNGSIIYASNLYWYDRDISKLNQSVLRFSTSFPVNFSQKIIPFSVLGHAYLGTGRSNIICLEKAKMRYNYEIGSNDPIRVNFTNGGSFFHTSDSLPNRAIIEWHFSPLNIISNRCETPPFINNSTSIAKHCYYFLSNNNQMNNATYGNWINTYCNQSSPSCIKATMFFFAKNIDTNLSARFLGHPAFFYSQTGGDRIHTSFTEDPDRGNTSYNFADDLQWNKFMTRYTTFFGEEQRGNTYWNLINNAQFNIYNDEYYVKDAFLYDKDNQTSQIIPANVGKDFWITNIYSTSQSGYYYTNGALITTNKYPTEQEFSDALNNTNSSVGIRIGYYAVKALGIE